MEFFRLAHRLGAGARGFAANVQDFRPLPGEFQCMSNGGICIKKFSAVGKRVGRDIDNAHDERRSGKNEFKLARSKNHLDELCNQTLRLK
jgi:hypothetical protein